jgi:Ca-activated chloride channel family protein
VLTYKEQGDEGFYLLLAAPKVEISSGTVIKKRTIFVIDRSGSMGGDKIIQARDALKFCINSLNPGDQFNIIDFSSEIRSFRNSPVSAQADHLSEALTYASGLEANGGTNINEALLEGLGDMQIDAYTNLIIFLTDGQPTVGETNEEMILSNIKTANKRNSRLFVFGVGYDVNTHLLDRLAEENSGVSAYVSPDEDIEVAVSSLFEKISMPVLSDCTLDFGHITVSDQFPQEVQDLFKGSQLVQLGKYLSTGTETVTLSGTANEESLTFSCEGNFTDEALDYDFIPRLWAIRKVGALLDQIRLIGENGELVDEVTLIAKRYGIITPYTSFLINEDVAPADNFQGIEDKSGALAFDNAVNIGAWRNAENANSTSSVGVKYIGNKTFFNRDSTWVDAQYDSSNATLNIEFGSSEYFQLLKANPELSTYYALGSNVRFSYEGNNYQITSESAVTPPPVPKPDDYELYQNAPNPFNPSTEIRFVLYSRSDIRISIYNMAGQHIRTLFEGVKPAGHYFLTWDGTNDKGIEMPSGLYLVKLSGERMLTRKIMLVR